MKRILIKVDGKNSHNSGVREDADAQEWLEDELLKHDLGTPDALKEGVEVVLEDVTEEYEKEKVNAEAYGFLANSDYKVLRHLRQERLGIPTSLSNE